MSSNVLFQSCSYFFNSVKLWRQKLISKMIPSLLLAMAALYSHIVLLIIVKQLISINEQNSKSRKA